MKMINWLTIFALTSSLAFAAGAKPKEHQKAEYLKKELNRTYDENEMPTDVEDLIAWTE